MQPKGAPDYLAQGVLWAGKDGYHHFDRAFLKGRLLGTKNQLIRLSFREAQLAITESRLCKTQFQKNGPAASDVGMQG